MTDDDGRRAWTVVQVAGIALALALFLWASREVLNPAVLFLVLAAALQPFRGRPGHSLLLGLAAAVTGVWILSTTGTLLAPFVLALGVAYVLDPLVDRIEATGRGRTTSVFLLGLPAVGVLVLVVLGGIYETERRETVTKVPVLGDLPGLGVLFRSNTELSNKAGLLIFVTPRILNEGSSIY